MTELGRIQNGSADGGVRIVSNATGERFLKRWRVGPGAEHPRHELVPNLGGQTVGLDQAFDETATPLTTRRESAGGGIGGMPMRGRVRPGGRGEAGTARL
jgi:hypothetical protein